MAWRCFLNNQAGARIAEVRRGHFVLSARRAGTVNCQHLVIVRPGGIGGGRVVIGRLVSRNSAQQCLSSTCYASHNPIAGYLVVTCVSIQPVELYYLVKSSDS